MDAVRDVALFALGLLLVFLVLDSALRTFVLPRGAVVRLTRMVSVAVRALFRARVRFAKTYEARDRIMALYGPLAMFALVVILIESATRWSRNWRTGEAAFETA